MLHEPYYDQSRMSKVWMAANNSTSVSHGRHAPLQGGLSNASQMSRHSQMTNYVSQPVARSVLLASDRRGPNLPPPLVSSTPYSRQVGNTSNPSSGGQQLRLNYQQYNRNAATSASARYQREYGARAVWQPPPPVAMPPPSSSRQTVVAFKKTPVFYDPQPAPQREQMAVYGDANSHFSMRPLASGTVNPARPNPNNFNHQHVANNRHHSSSGGDSCCSSCCSLSSAANQSSATYQNTSLSRQNDRGLSSYSCSSTCSCCSSCPGNGSNNFRQAPNGSTNDYRSNEQVASVMVRPINGDAIKKTAGAAKNVRARKERRSTIAGQVSAADVLQAQQQIASNRAAPDAVTPTPVSPSSAIYCNEAMLTPTATSTLGRRTKMSVQVGNTRATSKTIVDTNSRDSGIGATTPGAHSTSVHDILPAKQYKNSTPTNNSNSNSLVKTPSGSTRSSRSGASTTQGVAQTIAIAGDAEKASPTIYATTVQTPVSTRSGKSSMFLRLEEVRNSQLPNGEAFARNTSVSSSASSQPPRAPPPLKHTTTAGGQVAVGCSATRCVPAGNDRFIWVDDNYDEADTTVVKTVMSSTASRSDNKHFSGPVKAAIVPPSQQQQQQYHNGTLESTKKAPAPSQPPPHRSATVSRKHSSFFRNILTSLFGIRPRLHSDGDADQDLAVKRKPANRSQSAIFSRSSLKGNKKIAPPPSKDTNNGNSFFKAFNTEKSASSERNRTWHGLKSYNRNKKIGDSKASNKPDMRHVFDSTTPIRPSATIITTSAKLSGSSTVIDVSRDDDLKSTYTSLSKDDGSSTLGRPHSVKSGLSSTLPRPLSRGTSLKSSCSSRGPLFLVKNRGGSVTPVPPAAPTTVDPHNPSETAIIANVEQLLAMARVHPTLEYEWIPDDYFI